MAKATEDEEKRKPKRGEKTLTWIMTGMLIVGLGGFGATSFTSTVSSIGSVGEIDISANDYARALQQQRQVYGQQFGAQLSVQDMLNLGLGQQVLNDIITRSALDNESLTIGLSVGDPSVAAEIMKQASFTGPSGAFDRAAYGQTLQQNGWTETAYENMIRRDISRSLLQGAVAGGFEAPQALVDTIYRHTAEKRDFSLIRMGEYDLGGALPAPTEEEIRAKYDADIATYTRPEAKRIRYAALLPDMLAADQPVDEALLRQMYDENIDQYVVAERRLVERLIYPDQAARDAAMASGKSYEALVEERGLTMLAVDMGDVEEKTLGANGAAIFAAPEGALVPGETDLGPAIFRANGKLEGSEVTFEQAREDLAAELQHEEAARQISDRVGDIDDLLAGGESLESLASQMGMELGSVDYVPRQQGKAEIEGYQAFRDAADALGEGDFAEAILLDDGGVVAMEFVETLPPAPIPFEEAREAVAAALAEEKLTAALMAQANVFKTEAEGGRSLESLSIVDVTRQANRNAKLTEVPASLMNEVFTMTPGEIRVISGEGNVALLRLDAITAPPETGETAEAERGAIEDALRGSLAQDAFSSFSTAVSDKAGVTLDQNALNLVNTSLQ